MPGLLAAIVTLAFATSPMAAGREKPLKVGQEWRFEGRPDDPHPTLVIDRIEELPNIGEVVHVSLRGVRIRNPRAPGGFSDQLPHMPFARQALEKSVTVMLHDSVALPPYQEGYAEWKRARAGAFSISVREALDYVELGLGR